MNYRGYEIRQNAQGLWQAVRPTDLTWLDGIQATDRYALRSAIDAYYIAQTQNPWDLRPLPAKVAVAA
jgi:hypothetical protein